MAIDGKENGSRWWPRATSHAQCAGIATGIVVYRNSAEELARCLKSVAHQSAADRIDFICLHDNDDGVSAADIDAALEDARIPQEKVRRTVSRNCGFGAAHNLLQHELYAAHPSCSGYLCLNPDAVLHPTCAERLLDAAAAASWRGVFEALQFPVPHPKVYDARTGLTAWCSGCCLLMPKSVWENLGGFDTRFFMYCEDVDMSWRVKVWGGHCYSVPGAYVGHYVGDREHHDGPADMHLLRSACLLGHKWRSDAFAAGAARDLHERWGVDIDVATLVSGWGRVPTEWVVAAAPNFNHGLYFSRAYW